MKKLILKISSETSFPETLVSDIDRELWKVGNIFSDSSNGDLPKIKIVDNGKSKSRLNYNLNDYSVELSIAFDEYNEYEVRQLIAFYFNACPSKSVNYLIGENLYNEGVVELISGTISEDKAWEKYEDLEGGAF